MDNKEMKYIPKGMSDAIEQLKTYENDRKVIEARNAGNEVKR